MANNNSGYPKQGRGFSALGKLVKQGTYTNSKFIQAVSGQGEDISRDFLSPQQLAYSNGFGVNIDTPAPYFEETFYLAQESATVFNLDVVGTDLILTEAGDNLLWINFA
jgi:hypothetical protein